MKEISNLSVEKIINFLTKLDMKLYISRKPHTVKETYTVVDKRNRELIYTGDHNGFFKWLASITLIYERLFLEELYVDFLKESGRLN